MPYWQFLESTPALEKQRLQNFLRMAVYLEGGETGYPHVVESIWVFAQIDFKHALEPSDDGLRRMPATASRLFLRLMRRYAEQYAHRAVAGGARH